MSYKTFRKCLTGFEASYPVIGITTIINFKINIANTDNFTNNKKTVVSLTTYSPTTTKWQKLQICQKHSIRERLRSPRTSKSPYLKNLQKKQQIPQVPYVRRVRLDRQYRQSYKFQ